MAPPVEKFISRMRAMGVGDGYRVVIYDSLGLFSAARAWWLFRLFGKEDVAVFYRRVSASVVYRAFIVIFVSLGLVILLTGILTVIEPFPFLELFFEVISAFSTVGLSTGITSLLSSEGKVLLVVAMFIGRIGTLTLILSLMLRRRRGKYQYLKGKFRIG